MMSIFDKIRRPTRVQDVLVVSSAPPPVDTRGPVAHVYLAIQGPRAQRRLPALSAPRLPTDTEY
ncbi:MAG: hypothetical protein AAF928_21245 [Myxococcota bacterium]